MPKRLTAEVVASVVGGGVTLVDAQGRAVFRVLIHKTMAGITPAENKALSDQLATLINTYGLTVPDRDGS